MKLHLTRSGLQTSVQDRGRFRYRKDGVACAGALDLAALRLCQLLVGNDEGVAGIEIGGGRLAARFEDDRLIAWHGGVYEARVAGETIPARSSVQVRAGEVLELRAIEPSRTWLAISGGIDVPLILGSRSTHTRSGIGGNFLPDGEVLPLAAETDLARALRAAFSTRASSWSAPLFPVRKERLRVVAGKDWTEELGAELQGATFRISTQSDRMGLRLENAVLENVSGGAEQISEPVVPGTIQLPPNGQLILLLADCQTIGGYPKIAHVVTVDLADAAQLQSHNHVRFVAVPVDEARGWLQKREDDIALFAAGLRARFGN